MAQVVGYALAVMSTQNKPELIHAPGLSHAHTLSLKYISNFKDKHNYLV